MQKYLYLILFLPLWANAQQVTTIVQGNGPDDALFFDSLGNLYGSRYEGSAVFQLPPGGTSWNIFSDDFNTPNGLAFDREGSLFIADNDGNRIYKIDNEGNKEIFMDSIFSPSGIILDPNSDTLIVTSYRGHKILKIAPDGGVIEWASGGLLNGPVGLCYDDEGRLYTSNFNNRRIIRLAENGEQTLIVQAPGNGWLGFIAYAKGHIYATMFSTHKIYRCDLEGNGEIILGTLRGTVDGDPSSARFDTPNGIIATPSEDTLYISDYGSQSLRMITDLDGVSTSIKTLQKEDIALQISPNPASQILTLSMDLPAAQRLSIQLIDQQGKALLTMADNQKMPAGQQSISFQLGKLAKGIYHVQLIMEDQSIISEQFVKM